MDSVAFCPSSKSSQLLVTGSYLNCELKLWDISTLKCLQLIQIRSRSFQKQLANHFAFDKTGTFLFVVNSKDKSIYAFRVVPGSQDSQPMFDYLTEFSIAQPVLSFMITNHERGTSKPNLNPSSSPISEMQLHCVQTKAIQTYYVNSEQCYSKIGSVSSPAVTEEKLEEAKPVVSNAETKVQPAPKKAEVSMDQPKESPKPQEIVEVQEKPIEALSEPEQKAPPTKPQEDVKQDIPERKAEVPSEPTDPSLLTPSFFKIRKEKEEETAKEIVDQILSNVEQSSKKSCFSNT